MALSTHHLQGSCKIYSTPSSWSSGNKLKHSAKLHLIQRKENFISLKCKSCLSVRAPYILSSRSNQLKISAFKGNTHFDESSNKSNGSKSLKNSLKLSYASEEGEETLLEPSKAKNTPVSYSSANETSTRLIPIQNLFKYWLSLMRTPPPDQAMEEEAIEKPSSSDLIEPPKSLPEKKDESGVVMAILRYFMRLDATIIIPLLVFVPWYLAVNVIYGAEVSKELTPLWIIGPLILSLYIKMFRRICALYVYTFKQTFNVLLSIPSYSVLAYNYIIQGQLKKDLHACLIQPFVDIKNLDYKEFSRKKLKNLQNVLMEKHLDYKESVGPYYCRMIRFLRGAEYFANDN